MTKLLEVILGCMCIYRNYIFSIFNIHLNSSCKVFGAPKIFVYSTFLTDLLHCISTVLYFELDTKVNEPIHLNELAFQSVG